MEKVNLPDITGYLIAGMVIGPHVLNIIAFEALDNFQVITNIVLSIIAYQIGAELFLPILKRNGLKLVVITLVHTLITSVVVFFGIFLISQELWLAFALAGLAIASAPAPIMQVIKKLNAKGPVKGTIIPVVGLLDIIAVVLFGLFSSIALSLVNSNNISLYNALFVPFFEVGGSILIGVVLGSIAGVFSKIYIENCQKKNAILRT